MSNETMEFSPQTVTLPSTDGSSFTEEALVSGPFGIHQTRYKDKTLSPEWTVSHLPSGRCFLQEAVSLEAAQRLVAALAPLTDWTVIDPVPACRANPETLATIRLARRIASNVQCWVDRSEVEPQYDEPCSHEVCLEDIRLHRLGYDHWKSGWECPSGVCSLDRSRAECEREPGHDGDHQWAEIGAPTLSEWTRLPIAQPETVS